MFRLKTVDKQKKKKKIKKKIEIKRRSLKRKKKEEYKKISKIFVYIFRVKQSPHKINT